MFPWIRVTAVLSLMTCLSFSPTRASATRIEDCDRLAADPRDPEHVGAGVAARGMDIAAAVAACEAAVEIAPEERRLQYQLGRALFEQRDMTRALEAFGQAAALGHETAELALAVVHFAGQGGIQQDHEKAIVWLEKLAERPFS
jgi:TPR repeat protein